MTEVLRSEIMRLPSGSKLLDLGCGDMRLLLEISKMRPDLQLHGVDIGAIPSTNNNIHFTNADVTTFIADTEYQLVLAVDILEHLLCPERLVNTAWKSLASEGRFYTTVPSVTKLLLFGDENFFSDYSHIRPFSCKSMSRLLFDHGFDVRSTELVGQSKRSIIRLGYYLMRGIVTLNATYLNAVIRMVAGTAVETVAQKKIEVAC